MPTKLDTNPHNNNGQVEPVEANNKALYTTVLLSAMAPSSCTSAAPLSSFGASIKGAKGRPSPALLPAPISPARPPPPSGRLWAGHLTPAPHQIPDLAQAISATLPCPLSAVALVVTTARAA